MGYAVLHTTKGTSTGGIGNHIDRTRGMEHTYKHADPERKHLNVNFQVPENRHRMKFNEAVNDRIAKGYNGNRKIRDNAVRFTTHILTGSHEDMKRIFTDQKKKEEWISANYKFVAKEFGEQNIVRFALHLDEKTPHIHAVTVPLTADGRLSAKQIIGNRQTMQARQDRYAEAMKPFGLQRGIRNTGIKHENADRYYKRINVENEREIKPPRRVLGVYEAIGVVNQTNALKTAKIALKENDIKTQNAERKVNALNGQLTEIQQKIDRYRKNPNELQREIAHLEHLQKIDNQLEFAKSLIHALQQKKSEESRIIPQTDDIPEMRQALFDRMAVYHRKQDGYKLDKPWFTQNYEEIKRIDQQKGWNTFDDQLTMLARAFIAEQQRERRQQAELKEKEVEEKLSKILKPKAQEEKAQERPRGRGMRR